MRKKAILSAARLVALLFLWALFSSCTGPARQDSPYEPIPQQRFQKCAAEFAAKREYCANKHPEGSSQHVDCVNAAMANWNECASGKKAKRTWSWLPWAREGS